MRTSMKRPAPDSSPQPQVFLVQLVRRPSGLRPWRVLRSDRSELGRDLPAGLITHLETLFGPMNTSAPPAGEIVVEREVTWPTAAPE